MTDKFDMLDSADVLKSSKTDIRNTTKEEKLTRIKLEATNIPYVYLCDLSGADGVGVPSEIFVFNRFTCGSLSYVNLNKHSEIDRKRLMGMFSQLPSANVLSPEAALLNSIRSNRGIVGSGTAAEKEAKAVQYFRYQVAVFEAPNTLAEVLRTPWYNEHVSVGLPSDQYYTYNPKPLQA